MSVVVGGAADSAQDAPVQGRPSALYGRDFWLVFAATFALNVIGNLFVIFPLWIVDRGGGAGAIGTIVGTSSLAALATRPGVGVLIDRRGRRWTAISFLVLDAMAIALYLPIRKLGIPIYAVRAIHGAAEGSARVALFAMVYEILPRERQGRGMATFSLCGMIPGAIAPLVGEELTKRLGFAAFFAVSIALAALAALTTSALKVDRPVAHPAAREGAAESSYVDLFRDRGLLPLWIITLLFSLSISSRLSFVVPYAYQRGVVRAGWYFAIYSIAAIAVRIGGGRIMDRFGLERMLAPALAILGAGMAMVAGTGLPGILAAAAAVGGIGHGYLYPALSALVITRTRAGTAGRSSSIYSSLYDFGSMAGPYLMGGVALTLGYGPMFVASGAIALGAAVYFLAIEPAARRALDG